MSKLTCGIASLLAQNQTDAIQNRDNAAKTMTPAQIEEGQRRARQFVAHKEAGISNRADSLGALLGQ
jgi:hypothetical protein